MGYNKKKASSRLEIGKNKARKKKKKDVKKQKIKKNSKCFKRNISIKIKMLINIINFQNYKIKNR